MPKTYFVEDSGNVSQHPADGGTRAASNERNQISALFQGDLAPLRARAQSVANMTVQVNAALIQSFFAQVHRDGQPVTYAGGSSGTITAPSANPRYDILVLNDAGSLEWITGDEAGSPDEPWDDVPAGAIPICVVYCRTTMTKIVNYEDKDANSTHGYIAKDARPLFGLGGGSSGGQRSEYGCVLGNNASDATNDLDISAGAYWDDTGSYLIRLTSAIVKRGDTTFVAGTGNGGGNITGSAGLRYCYLIGKSADSEAADVFFSTSSPGAVSLPSGWDIKRFIGARYWTGSAWIKFFTIGNGTSKWTEFFSPILLASSFSGGFTDVDSSSYIPDGYARRITVVASSFQNSVAQVTLYARVNGSSDAAGNINKIGTDHDDQSGPGNPNATMTWEQILDENGIFELAYSGGSGDVYLRGFMETI